MIKIFYFARIKENLGLGQEVIPLPASITTVGALTQWLGERGVPWQAELAAGKALRVAVNQSMVSLSAVIQDGDEIAYFPPVTGG